MGMDTKTAMIQSDEKDPVLWPPEKCGKSPDLDGAGVFSGSMGSCLGVSAKKCQQL